MCPTRTSTPAGTESLLALLQTETDVRGTSRQFQAVLRAGPNHWKMTVQCWGKGSTLSTVFGLGAKIGERHQPIKEIPKEDNKDSEKSSLRGLLGTEHAAEVGAAGDGSI